MRILPTFKDYTIDYRLKELRRATPGAELQFIDFRSEEGWQLLEEAWQDGNLVIRREGNDSGENWVCVCGNRPSDLSFFPCNWSGEAVEQTPETWPVRLWYCIQCGRIIDSDTLAVVSLQAETQEPVSV